MKAGVEAVGSFVGAGEGFFVGAYYKIRDTTKGVEWNGNDCTRYIAYV